MQKTLQRAGNIVLRSTALLMLIICGCESATVYVSHPQVFTRERLVTSRQRELQFLYKQLEKGPAGGFQGAIDERLLQAFQAAVSGTLSATPIATSQPAQLVNVANLVGTPPTTQNTATNVTLSSEDQLADAEAFRSAVNALIRQYELDDTHDLSGHTLYTLKFDSAMFPGTSEKKPVVVDLSLSLPKDAIAKLDKKQLYKDWVNYLNQRLNQEKVDLVARFEARQLTTADKLMFTTYVFDGVATAEKDFTTGSDAKALLDRISENPLWGLVHNGDLEEQKKDPAGYADRMQDFVGALYFALEGKYSSEFTGLIKIGHTVVGTAPAGLLSSTKRPLIASKIASSEGCSDQYLAEFGKRLRIPTTGQSVDENDLYVDSIDPQVYAQNLSDVSQNNRLLGLSIAMSAMISNNASAAGNAQYLQDDQKILQSIKRNPLAVSYHSGQHFGWLLGSPFKIEGTEPQFDHQPARQSFAVSFVAPVWVNEISIDASAHWLKPDGSPDGCPGDKVDVPDASHQITLPTDFDAITTALLFYSNGKRAPTIGTPPATWVLQTGSTEDQTLLIFGTDLWRNPQVYVESQKADTVELLPNMGGLLAHFSKIPAVKKETRGNLTVVTSFGTITLDNQPVKLLPPAAKAPSQLSATLAAGFAVGSDKDNPLTFTIDPSAMPDNSAGFVLRIRPANSAVDWITIDTTAFTRSADKKTYYFPLDASKITIPGQLQPPGPTAMLVDLRLKPNLFDEPVNLLTQTDPSDRTFMYFATKDQQIPRLAAVTISFDKQKAPTPTSIQLTPVDGVLLANLYSAYPGLQDSVKAGSATLTLSSSTLKADLLLSTDPNSLAIDLKQVTTTTQLPAGTYETARLTFKQKNGTLSSPITVIITSPAGAAAGVGAGGAGAGSPPAVAAPATTTPTKPVIQVNWN